MKRTLRPWLLAVGILAPLALAASAGATVLWTSTFEGNKSGDLCSGTAATFEWKPGINETKNGRKNAEILGEQVHGGALACKITVHPDDTLPPYNQDRVDIQHPLVMPTGDIWISGHYMMPDDAKVRNEIGFFETQTSFQNWIDFWVEPKTGGGTTLSLGVEQLGGVKIWTGDFTKGQWHQVAIHVVQSTVANGGTMDFWLDGKQVVTAYKHKTKPNNDPFFFQAGLHRKLPSPDIDVVYMDDFIQGTEATDLKISTPAATDGGAASDGSSSADSDGGTAGSTGVAGSIGTAGSTGSAGANGAAGVTGTAGIAGSAGATGSAGVSGSAGATGSIAGSTGFAGMTGSAGSTATTSGAATGSGCSCRMAPTDGLAWPGLLTFLAGLSISRRRRRRAG